MLRQEGIATKVGSTLIMYCLFVLALHLFYEMPSNMKELIGFGLTPIASVAITKCKLNDYFNRVSKLIERQPKRVVPAI